MKGNRSVGSCLPGSFPGRKRGDDPMKGKSLKQSGLLAGLTLAIAVGIPGLAAAQQAKLYELVENLDTAKLGTGHRVSSWTAQGTAEAGSPFCPTKGLPKGATSCTITSF